MTHKEKTQARIYIILSGSIMFVLGALAATQLG